MILNQELGIATTARLVRFKTSQGFEIEATLLRLTPQSVNFEVSSPTALLQLSEVLSEFKLLADDRTIYKGEAVVDGLISTGTSTVCSATIRGSLLDLDCFKPEGGLAGAGFNGFLSRWQRFYRIAPEYKLAVANLQSFLSELRLWLDQVQIELLGCADHNRQRIERELIEGEEAGHR